MLADGNGGHGGQLGLAVGVAMTITIPENAANAANILESRGDLMMKHGETFRKNEW